MRLIFRAKLARGSLLLLLWLGLNSFMMTQVAAATPTPDVTPAPATKPVTVTTNVTPTLKPNPSVAVSTPNTPVASSSAPAATTPPRPASSQPKPTSTKAAPSASPTPSAPTATPTPAQPKLVTRPPVINAAGAIAIDAATGKILYSKNAERSVPMASTTKIMTALTLLSQPGIDLDAETVVVPDDLVGEANMGLVVGERIRLRTLLIGLLTNSANEAGMALARYAGAKLPGPGEPVERFVAQMNAKALSLGMFQSHYMNPHGLDQPGHYSSAYDLAISGWYALKQPTIANIVRLDRYNYQGHDFYNVNNFVRRYPGATGIKPGLTDDAGLCLVASASFYGHQVIAVILNDENMTTEIDNLMDYSFSVLTGRAEPQPVQTGPNAYIGLPQGNKLLPFDITPVLDFLRWLGTSVGQWLKALQATPN